MLDRVIDAGLPTFGHVRAVNVLHLGGLRVTPSPNLATHRSDREAPQLGFSNNALPNPTAPSKFEIGGMQPGVRPHRCAFFGTPFAWEALHMHTHASTLSQPLLWTPSSAFRV